MFLPTQHIGLILLWQLSRQVEFGLSGVYELNFESDSKVITEFYRQSGRTWHGRDIADWLARGFKCISLMRDGRRLAAAWIWHGKCDLPALSGRCFSSNRTIEFSPRTAYLCFVSVRPELRNQGLNTKLLNLLLSNKNIEKAYDRIVATTGTDNGGFIISSTRAGAEIIGVVAVRRWLNSISRNEHFVDRTRRCWK